MKVHDSLYHSLMEREPAHGVRWNFGHGEALEHSYLICSAWGDYTDIWHSGGLDFQINYVGMCLVCTLNRHLQCHAGFGVQVKQDLV